MTVEHPHTLSKHPTLSPLAHPSLHLCVGRAVLMGKGHVSNVLHHQKKKEMTQLYPTSQKLNNEPVSFASPTEGAIPSPSHVMHAIALIDCPRRQHVATTQSSPWSLAPGLIPGEPAGPSIVSIVSFILGFLPSEESFEGFEGGWWVVVAARRA